MPIDDRLDRENVAHIHHGILCSHQKQWVRVLCRDLDELGEHRSQQTDTRTENETLIGRWWTVRTHGHREGSITRWGLWGGTGEGQRGVGSWGEIAWGEMQDIGDGEEGSTSHCHMCTCATILHVLHMYPKTENAIKKILEDMHVNNTYRQIYLGFRFFSQRPRKEIT